MQTMNVIEGFSSRRARLSPASFVRLSLRNHLCIVALRGPHGKPFHLGTIVRTMFECFYLYEAGYGDADPAVFIAADQELGSLSQSALENSRYFLDEAGFRATLSLLELYDRQLEHAPLQAVIDSSKKADRNFNAGESKRRPIPELVQSVLAWRAGGLRRCAYKS